nr:hypothetical protein [Tanacetum cinerariifolium]
MQPPMTSLEYINDPTEAMNVILILFAKAFQLTTPTNNNKMTSSNPRNHQIAQPERWIQVSQNAVQNAGVQNGGNQKGLVVVPRIANQNGTGNIVVARAEGTGNGNQARCYNCRGLGHIARNYTAGAGMLLIFRPSCSLLKRKKQGFNFKQKNLTSWLL